MSWGALREARASVQTSRDLGGAALAAGHRMKPRTVRDLLVSLGLTAGLGAANPACGGSLNPQPEPMVTNPPPEDSGIPTTFDASNPPLPDAAPWPDAVTNPPPLEGGLRPDADTSDTSDAADVVDGVTDGGEGDGHEVG